jgi:hypothetical protein
MQCFYNVYILAPFFLHQIFKEHKMVLRKIALTSCIVLCTVHNMVHNALTYWDLINKIFTNSGKMFLYAIKDPCKMPTVVKTVSASL